MTFRLALAAGLIVAAVIAYWWLRETGTLDIITDSRKLKSWIQELGFWGPLLLIGLMIGAIVMSPIPSGPIAMVAGAAFGPVLGTIYVSIGASLGAIIAFLIARFVGFEVVARWSRAQALIERLGAPQSQNWLMLVVFASRLVPFISFDAVSYAAGLTPLALWRFAVATVAGVVPISFVLAYFGEEVIASDSPYATAAAILIGGITLGPLLWRLVRTRGASKPRDPEQNGRPCNDPSSEPEKN